MTPKPPLDQSIIDYMLAHPAELAAAHQIAFSLKATKGGLTLRQVQLLDYIRSYAAENGTTPSYAEMVAALDIRSKSGIARLVVSLEERGFIRRLGRHMVRSIVLVEKPE